VTGPGKNEENDLKDLPLIVSADDHVLEPMVIRGDASELLGLS
jgi:hypothetical protein